MSAVYGLLLVNIAVLVFGGSLIATRRPNAPRWLTESAAASAITIITIALFVLGIGLTIQFTVSYGREPLGFIETSLIGGLLIALAVVLAAIGRRLRGTDAPATQPPARRSEPAASATPDRSSAVPSTPPTTTPSPSPTPGRPPRKRAA